MATKDNPCIVQPVASNLWRVTGLQPEPYIVNRNHNVLHCNCKGNYLGHRRCRHIAAVEEFIKQESLTAP